MVPESKGGETDHQIRQSEEAAQEVDSRIKFGGWQKPAKANYPYVSQGSQTYLLPLGGTQVKDQ